MIGRVNSRPASFLILTLLPTCSMKRASKVRPSELVQVRIGSSACRENDSRIEDKANRISLTHATQSKGAHLSRVWELNIAISKRTAQLSKDLFVPRDLTSNEETAVCNLGSIVIDRHISKTGKLDKRMLRNTISVAIEALDNVIDTNFYPTSTAEYSNKRNRSVGLGVMGLQNALYKMGVSFDSDSAVSFSKELMENISYLSIEASSNLAKELGTYETYKGSKWDMGFMPQDTIKLLEKERGTKLTIDEVKETLDWEALRQKVAEHGMRNSNLMAIAPTATISLIMNTTPAIEPVYRNLFVKSNLSGDFTVLNRFLVRDLKKANKWNERTLDDLKYFNGDLTELEYIPDEIKQRYKTAFDIDPEWVIKAVAERQVWIDQAQSTNLWLKEPSASAMPKIPFKT